MHLQRLQRPPCRHHRDGQRRQRALCRHGQSLRSPSQPCYGHLPPERGQEAALVRGQGKDARLYPQGR
ncbi:hypothetical protein 2209_scaffold2350_00077 [Bacteriophage sp.]|nr:hypothetical protein 2209_scaffold2350_00077 [Bacteriophage sp.]